jgi:hypothetical protein
LALVYCTVTVWLDAPLRVTVKFALPPLSGTITSLIDRLGVALPSVIVAVSLIEPPATAAPVACVIVAVKVSSSSSIASAPACNTTVPTSLPFGTRTCTPGAMSSSSEVKSVLSSASPENTTSATTSAPAVWSSVTVNVALPPSANGSGAMSIAMIVG